MKKRYEVIELLQPAEDLDDMGRDMVKTKCLHEGKIVVVYVQHPLDNRMIAVGYVVEL